MRKTIKIDEKVYLKLDDFRDRHETFSEAVERLLAAQDMALQLASILEGQFKFQEWKYARLADLQAAQR